MSEMKRFLEKVAAVLDDRGAGYGNPVDTLDDIARRWSMTLGTEVSPEQVAMCMIELKLVRLQRTSGHLDSVADIAGYAACLNEVMEARRD